MQFHAVARDVLLVEQLTTLVKTEPHDGTYIFSRCDDARPDIRLLDVVDERRIRESAGVVHLHGVALLVVDHIRDIGHRGDHLHVEFPVESLLHDFHVEQAEEAATEAKAQSLGRLRHKRQCGIVELQFLKRRSEVLIFIGVDWVNTCKHHRLHLLESLNSLVAGLIDVGDGFAYLHFGSVLNTRDDIADFTR